MGEIMKKLIIFIASILMCLFMAVGLSACDNDTLRTDNSEINEEYGVVYGLQLKDAIVYNKKTKICYLMIWKEINGKQKYAFIMLYDKDGQPLIYDGE